MQHKRMLQFMLHVARNFLRVSHNQRLNLVAYCFKIKLKNIGFYCC